MDMDIKLINNCLKNGGVICFPTETICALSCDATQLDAINKIYKIKARDKAKPLSILLPNIEEAKKYVVVDRKAEALIKKFSPGPVTYVLPNKDLPNWPESVGIRIPDHSIAQEILKNYPHPLVGTSVNISGEESARTIDDIPDELREYIDMIIKDSPPPQLHPHESGLASTIVDLSTEGKVSIIREGAISGDRILHYYHSLP